MLANHCEYCTNPSNASNRSTGKTYLQPRSCISRKGPFAHHGNSKFGRSFGGSLRGQLLPPELRGNRFCSADMQDSEITKLNPPSIEVEESAVVTSPQTLEAWDKAISLRLYKHVGSHLPRPAFMLLEHSGSGAIWLPLVPLIWLAPQLSMHVRMMVANLFLGLWIDIALIGLAKGSFKRQRPVYNHLGDFVVIVGVDKFSFPSGHASRVGFLGSFALVCLWGSRPELAGLLVAWAITTAVSRALMGRHYLGDVMAGLLLGLITTAILTQGKFTVEGCWISPELSQAAYLRTLELLHPLLRRLPPALGFPA